MSEPRLVYKTRYDGGYSDDDALFAEPSAESALPWSEIDPLLGAVADALGDLREEWRAETEARMQQLERRIDALRDREDLRSQIAELRGMVSMLINKTADGSKGVELQAEEIVRKVRTTRKP